MNPNQIYHMDCREGLALLPDNSIDLVVTSPPYDNLRTYEGTLLWNESVWKEVLSQLYRVVKVGGVAVWIVGDATVKGSETGTSFKQALWAKEVGFNLHDTMIWAKDAMVFPEINRYGACFEYMFVLSKGKPKTFNPIKDKENKWAGHILHGTTRGQDGKTFRKSNHKKGTVQNFGSRLNVWRQSGEKSNRTGHPAVFPEKLVIDHILSWSKEGELVLDPFMGSGTTAVAAMKTGRQYIGFEAVEQYCEIARKRLEEPTK